MKKIIIIFWALLSTMLSFSQGGVSINNSGTAPNPNSMLDVSSDDKGVLITRLTTTARVTLGGALGLGDNGMLVYDKDLLVFYYWDGTQWVLVGSGTGDDWGADVVNISGTNIMGDGTPGAPIVVTEVDGDITNEIQDLSLNPTTNILTITNNGTATSIDLTPYLDNTDNQDLSLTGDVLSLTGDGTTVDLSTLKDHDWYEVGGTTQADAITDNIFTQGNVGVGVATPLTKLHVQNQYAGQQVDTSVYSNYIPQSSLGITHFLASGASTLGASNNIGLHVDFTATNNNNEYGLYIDGESKSYFSNKVGIGTNAPKEKLDVANDPGSTGHNLALSTVGETDYWSIMKRPQGYVNPDNFHIAYFDGTVWNTHFDILPSGNVGINSSVPTNKLDIGGDLRVRVITSGISSDEVLVVDASGVVKKVAPSSPAGEVITFAGSTAPTGFLLCDGSAVSRITYSNLFAVIGTTYGVGNGATTFNLPDLRGEFIRGFDAGRGVDVGRVNGSFQSTALPNVIGQTLGGFVNGADNLANNITGPIGNQNNGTFATNSGTQASNALDSQHRIVLDLSKGSSVYQNGVNESRPRNIAMNYCIKF